MSTDTDPLDDLMSLPEAAEELDLPERDVRELLETGTLRGTKVGGRWVTTATAVEDLADDLDDAADDDAAADAAEDEEE